MFGDSRAKTNDAILKGWKNHFERLYCPSNEYSYDNQFKHEVEKIVSTYLQRTENEVPISLLPIEELTEIVRALPTNKSASCDHITYEHIKYGGEALLKTLLVLFNSIIEHETLPDGFKTGLTITLHKGHGKSRSDPNNYRAISLLPVISKLFEKVILKRLEHSDAAKQINPLQYGFQKGKSCKMVSLLLQESWEYLRERNSDMHVC